MLNNDYERLAKERCELLCYIGDLLAENDDGDNHINHKTVQLIEAKLIEHGYMEKIQTESEG